MSRCNDHAALRYFIATVDARKLGRKPKIASVAASENKDKPPKRGWVRLDNAAL